MLIASDDDYLIYACPPERVYDDFDDSVVTNGYKAFRNFPAVRVQPNAPASSYDESADLASG